MEYFGLQEKQIFTNYASSQWTKELCEEDSDGDGLTNGQELGDPDCVLMAGDTPARSTGISHPGEYLQKFYKYVEITQLLIFVSTVDLAARA